MRSNHGSTYLNGMSDWGPDFGDETKLEGQRQMTWRGRGEKSRGRWFSAAEYQYQYQL